jgi:hypothetical protein
MRLTTALLAVLAAVAVSPALGQQSPQQLTLSVEAGNNPPKSVDVSGSNGDSTSIAPGAMAAIVTDAYESQPMTLVINWTSDHSTSLPALLLPAFDDLTIRMYAERSNFTIDRIADADDLCFHTAPNDVHAAFLTMFSCEQWVHVLEVARDHGSKAYLRGLRGWFDGAYFLFTRVRPTRGVGLTPWGLPPDLVERLQDILDLIDKDHSRTEDSFAPYLRIADIRQALEENDRWKLKLYGLFARLGRSGDWSEADDVNQQVFAAYDRIVGPDSSIAIDGVDRAGLNSNAALIATKLSLQDGN